MPELPAHSADPVSRHGHPAVVQDGRMQMSIMIAQVPAVWDVDANLATLREVLGETRPGDVVVRPEGLLSGHGEDLTPLDATDSAPVDHAVAQAAGLAKQKQVHIFCGSQRPRWVSGCEASRCAACAEPAPSLQVLLLAGPRFRLAWRKLAGGLIDGRERAGRFHPDA
jgi:hypothetical protein